MPTALIRQLDDRARRRADEVCVQPLPHAPGGDDAPALTWGRWRAAATALAGRLSRETEPDAVVLVGIGNHPAFHVAVLGTLLADRRAMLVSPESTANEIEQFVARTAAPVAIGPDRLLERTATLSLTRIERDALLHAPADGTESAWAQHVGRGAVLLLSSGTTGQAKIVQRTIDSLDTVARGCAQGIGFRDDDRVLLTVPLHHSYGLEHGLLTPLLAGSRVALVHTFDADAVLRRLLAGDDTIFPSVPFICEALAQAHGRLGGDVSGVALRRAYSAGGPLPAAVYEQWRDTLGVRLGQLYGSTEIGSVTFNDPDLEAFDPASVGAPLPGADLRVLDRDQPRPDQPLPAGEEGRVAVAWPGMMQRYLDTPCDEIIDGFFLTHDVGRLDARGRLTLTGRMNLLIDLDGRKVNPAEVEGVLLEHPDVAEAVVVAMPMTPTVNRLKAVVVPRAGAALEVEQLRRFARARLSAHKRPRAYELRQQLPRSPMGKILREALQCS